MKCLYCLTEFFPEFEQGELQFGEMPRAFPEGNADSVYLRLTYRTTTCPACLGGHVGIRRLNQHGGMIQDYRWTVPRAGKFPPAPPHVPTVIASDYREANEVLPVSAKASAALSRRCLQAVLSAAGYSSRNLADQVQNAIEEESAAKALPPSLRDSLDAIRNFGNFSAHPITDQTTLQIIDVEEGEAEWCLELLVDLFDHYYVKPALAAERRAALAEKLSAAGKPPMKQGAEESAESEIAESG
ncbi:DUF4145 domain-containing protein [Sphingomonas sp.]|uniref:DUF4145 domain-containing protein n=1 Tax=Sphingomonas sp. TaxID=28214 RepID=UPI0038A04E8E